MSVARGSWLGSRWGALQHAGREHPVLAVAAIACAVRAVTAAVVYAGWGGTLFLDDDSYSRLAAQAANGGDSAWDGYYNWLYERTFTLLGPIDGLYTVAGEVELLGQAWLVLAGTFAAAATTFVALHFLSRRWAFAAGVVVAILPSQVLWSSLILKDALVWACMAGLAAVVVALNRAHSPRRAALVAVSGALLLVALAYTRQQTFVLACWALVFALALGPRRAWAARVAPALAVLALLPAAVSDYGVAGHGIAGHVPNFEEQRAASAVGADSAIVTARPLGEPTEEERAAERQQAGDGRGRDGGGRDREEKPPPAAEPPPPAPAGETIRDDLSYLPRGAAAFLLRPYPWEVGVANVQLAVASFENVLWYVLFALALAGLGGAWRHRDALAFPVAALAGTIAMYSLTEGNLGTAFRHRGEILWALVLLAALGARTLAVRARRRRSEPRGVSPPAARAEASSPAGA